MPDAGDYIIIVSNNYAFGRKLTAQNFSLILSMHSQGRLEVLLLSSEMHRRPTLLLYLMVQRLCYRLLAVRHDYVFVAIIVEFYREAYGRGNHTDAYHDWDFE